MEIRKCLFSESRKSYDERMEFFLAVRSYLETEERRMELGPKGSGGGSKLYEAAL